MKRWMNYVNSLKILLRFVLCDGSTQPIRMNPSHSAGSKARMARATKGIERVWIFTRKSKVHVSISSLRCVK